MPFTERWLLIQTSTPLRISACAISACMSEKPIARSGCNSRMRSSFALVNADTRGFSRRARRPHGEARDASDAVLFADGVQHLGRLLGQADNALGVLRADHVGVQR